MNLQKYLPWGTAWHEHIEAGLRQRLGDGDALLLIPYDDGTFWLKRGYYDKELVGGKGGYETPDEDKFVVDGAGDAKRSLFGVPVALAIDPSEHAGVVEPIKALIGQKNNMGEWLRVDREDRVAQVGSALEPAPDGMPEQSPKIQEEMLKENVDSVHEALLNLAEAGDLRKLYDLTPKRRAVDNPSSEVSASAETDGGVDLTKEEFDFDEGYDPDVEDELEKLPTTTPEPELVVEEATGFIVDQSKAAELLPKKWTSEKLQVMQDKARMEEYDEGKALRYLGYGALAGFLMTLVSLGMFWFLGQIGGGLF